MNNLVIPAALAGLLWTTCALPAPAATSVHIPGRPKAARAAFTVAGVTPSTVTNVTASAASRAATRGTVSPDRKTLTFGQKAVRLVVTSGPDSDMLSYRIAGLRNPTLVVPVGATLKALFINMDEDMAHNLRFSAQRGPFKKAPQAGLAVGTTDLPHRTGTALRAEDVTLHVPTRRGAYTYLCTVRGHAQGGMYGTLIVR